MKTAPRKRPSQRLADVFVERARDYVGYKARPNKVTQFGERLQLNGLPWDGAFIEHVLYETGIKKLSGGIALPSMAYPPVALSYFVKTARLFTKPRRGDIAFFEFSTDDDYGMPHVGIVTDVGTDGSFLCVEGMVGNGKPRSQQVNDGVNERQRHAIETVGFGRLDFKRLAKVSAEGAARDATGIHITDDGGRSARRPTVSLPHLRLGSANKQVETVQLALHVVTGVEGMQRGMFCPKTRIAFAKFQRMLGYPSSASTGVPDETSLKALGSSTKLFNFKS